MNFLFVAPRFHTNQASIVRCLRDNGHSVSFHVLFQSSIESKILTPVKISTCMLSNFLTSKLFKTTSNSPKSFPNIIIYAQIFKRLNPDIVVIRDPFRWFSITAAIISRIYRKKIIFYSQIKIYQQPHFFKSSIALIINFLFDSVWMSPILGSYNDKSSRKMSGISYVPFCIYPQTTVSQLTKPNNPCKILAIGKFESRKNHLFLLKVLNKLKSKYRFKLLIAGECSTKQHQKHLSEIKQFVINEKLGDCVDIRINVPFESMSSFYRVSDLFVLPSSNEPASISVLEALAHAVPVISSSDNGTSSYIIDSVNGFLFNIGDETALYNQFESFFSSLKLQDKFKSQSFFLSNMFSPDLYYESLSELIMRKWKI